MPRRWFFLAGAGAMAAFALPLTGSTVYAGDPTSVARGRQLFAAVCAVCHGESGDGRGPAAHMLAIQPRDFRSGIFKFRSTPTGSLPTGGDLFTTITRGLRWTGMVGRRDLPESDRGALVEFVKALSPRFAAERPERPAPVPAGPPFTPALVREGKAVYEEAGCVECHGPAGRGDGPAARGERDAWGNLTRPSDLTWRPLKRGSDPADTYRTIVTGLDGSPMPSYGDALEPGQVWGLVAFLEALVPSDHRLSSGALLGEERTGWMIIRMGGMMRMIRGMGGMGMMPGRRAP